MHNKHFTATHFVSMYFNARQNVNSYYCLFSSVKLLVGWRDRQQPVEFLPRQTQLVLLLRPLEHVQ